MLSSASYLYPFSNLPLETTNPKSQLHPPQIGTTVLQGHMAIRAIYALVRVAR